MVTGVTFFFYLYKNSRALEIIPLPLIFKTERRYHHSYFFSIKMFDRGTTKDLGGITDNKKSVTPSPNSHPTNKNISIKANLVSK